MKEVMEFKMQGKIGKNLSLEEQMKSPEFAEPMTVLIDVVVFVVKAALEKERSQILKGSFVDKVVTEGAAQFVETKIDAVLLDYQDVIKSRFAGQEMGEVGPDLIKELRGRIKKRFYEIDKDTAHEAIGGSPLAKAILKLTLKPLQPLLKAAAEKNAWLKSLGLDDAEKTAELAAVFFQLAKKRTESERIAAHALVLQWLETSESGPHSNLLRESRSIFIDGVKAKPLDGHWRIATGILSESADLIRKKTQYLCQYFVNDGQLGYALLHSPYLIEQISPLGIHIDGLKASLLRVIENDEKVQKVPKFSKESQEIFVAAVNRIRELIEKHNDHSAVWYSEEVLLGEILRIRSSDPSPARDCFHDYGLRYDILHEWLDARLCSRQIAVSRSKSENLWAAIERGGSAMDPDFRWRSVEQGMAFEWHGLDRTLRNSIIQAADQNSGLGRPLVTEYGLALTMIEQDLFDISRFSCDHTNGVRERVLASLHEAIRENKNPKSIGTKTPLDRDGKSSEFEMSIGLIYGLYRSFECFQVYHREEVSCLSAFAALTQPYSLKKRSDEVPPLRTILIDAGLSIDKVIEAARAKGVFRSDKKVAPVIDLGW